MKHILNRSLLTALTGLTFLGVLPVAHAQREAPTRDDRRAERQQANDNLTPQQQAQNFQARIQERMKSMTPEQRAAMQQRIAEFQQKMTDAGIDPNDPDALQKARDAGLFGQGGGNGNNRGQGGRNNRGNGGARAADAMKQMMNAAGITNFDTQDAIVAYVNEQNKARVTLLQLAKTAATALQAPVVAPANVAEDGVRKAADAKVATTFDAYETAVKAEDDRQEKALKDLDAKIHYSTTPRIKAFLTLVGILNNDVLSIGGPAAVFAPPPTQNGNPRQANTNNRGQGRGNRG